MARRFNPEVANKQLRCSVCSHIWQPRRTLKVYDCPQCRCKAEKFPPVVEEQTEQRCSCCKQNFPLTLEFFNRNIRHLNGLHNVCRKCGPVQNEEWRKNNPERMSQIRKRYEDKIKQELGEEEYVIHTKRRMELIQSNLKMEFLAAYGNKCECCSETIPQFLTLDHIEGGGIKHRRSIPGGNVYRALKKEGWPKEGYRILCMNCNFATRFGAICPHIRQKFDLLLAVNP